MAFPESKQYPFYDRCHHKKLNFRKIIDQVGIEFDSKKWETNETVKCEEWEYDFSLISYPSIGVEVKLFLLKIINFINKNELISKLFIN